MRVRVVDDAPGLAGSVAALLHDYGHVAIPTTANFAALLSAPAWVGIDAVLLDLHLNEAVSGRVIADWLGANAPWVRIIVLTGGLDDPTDLGAVRLLKPADIGSVLAALEG